MGNLHILYPSRNGQGIWGGAFDSLVPPDHDVRLIWRVVTSLDLSALNDNIRSVCGGPGRPAIDPRVLLALWLYATWEGVTSARKLAERCQYDDRFKWLAGGIDSSYHVLSTFRAENSNVLDRIFTTHVTSLATEGLLQLDVILLDGTRVRASAGASSFRTQEGLEAIEQNLPPVAPPQHPSETLIPGLPSTPANARKMKSKSGLTRRQAARERGREDRRARVARARAAAQKLKAERVAAGTDLTDEEKKKTKKKMAKGKVRASTTDPSARVMRMADHGFRPAHNVQVAVDATTQLIVAVKVTDAPTDGQVAGIVMDDLERRLGRRPKELVADGGYATYANIKEMARRNIKFFARPMRANDPSGSCYQPKRHDPKAVAEWRTRMGTDEGRKRMKERPRVEWVFARLRNWGLRLGVRGHEAVHSVVILHALLHNILQAEHLRKLDRQRAAAAA